MQQDDYLTVAEAATKLRVNPVTIQRLCRSGELDALRVGRAYRIPKAAFEAYRRGRPSAPRTVEVDRVYDAELSALIQAWQRDMEVGARPCSRDTIQTHRKHMHKYIRTLLGGEPALRITLREAVTEAALGRVMARIPVTQFATRYNVFMAVMAFSRFLVERGLMDDGDRLALKRHKPKRLLPPKRTVLHSLDEVNRFLEALWASEAHTTYEKVLNAAAVGLMVFAGLRVSEVAHLQLAHLDLAGGILFVHQGKGGKSRMVGINPRLRDMLAEYLRMRPPMGAMELLLSAKGTPLTRDYLVKRIRRIARRAGLDVSAHGLRRTFATLNANAGKSLNHIQLALGHAAISTTQAYLMADQRTAAREMQGW
ncbi:MAG: integrase family protein [Rubrobacteraceae bacterium]|jgi:excisionase family DNA binding protein|nr:integrase family protein [Rubrobacteraceae bacterium]